MMNQANYTLLIVDDDDFMLTNLELAFAESGYKTITCNDPFKAYQIIESERIDIVILDIVMPKMDGLILLEKIKEFNGMIQVIMLTGEITANNTIRAFRKGAVDIFFKPLESMEEIRSAVKNAAMRLDRVNTILKRIAKKEA